MLDAAGDLRDSILCLTCAGKHADAINEYTKAIALNPMSNVYYSNRAIACIKLFRFEQASLCNAEQML